MKEQHPSSWKKYQIAHGKQTSSEKGVDKSSLQHFQQQYLAPFMRFKDESMNNEKYVKKSRVQQIQNPFTNNLLNLSNMSKNYSHCSNNTTMTTFPNVFQYNDRSKIIIDSSQSQTDHSPENHTNSNPKHKPNSNSKDKPNLNAKNTQNSNANCYQYDNKTQLNKQYQNHKIQDKKVMPSQKIQTEKNIQAKVNYKSKLQDQGEDRNKNNHKYQHEQSKIQPINQNKKYLSESKLQKQQLNQFQLFNLYNKKKQKKRIQQETIIKQSERQQNKMNKEKLHLQELTTNKKQEQIILKSQIYQKQVSPMKQFYKNKKQNSQELPLKLEAKQLQKYKQVEQQQQIMNEQYFEMQNQEENISRTSQMIENIKQSHLTEQIIIPETPKDKSNKEFMKKQSDLFGNIKYKQKEKEKQKQKQILQLNNEIQIEKLQKIQKQRQIQVYKDKQRQRRQQIERQTQIQRYKIQRNRQAQQQISRQKKLDRQNERFQMNEKQKQIQYNRDVTPKKKKRNKIFDTAPSIALNTIKNDRQINEKKSRIKNSQSQRQFLQNIKAESRSISPISHFSTQYNNRHQQRYKHNYQRSDKKHEKSKICQHVKMLEVFDKIVDSIVIGPHSKQSCQKKKQFEKEIEEELSSENQQNSERKSIKNQIIAQLETNLSKINSINGIKNIESQQIQQIIKKSLLLINENTKQQKALSYQNIQNTQNHFHNKNLSKQQHLKQLKLKFERILLVNKNYNEVLSKLQRLQSTIKRIMIFISKRQFKEAYTILKIIHEHLEYLQELKNQNITEMMIEKHFVQFLRKQICLLEDAYQELKRECSQKL